MAIKFVDIETGGEKPKPSKPRPDAAPPADEAAGADKLPHAKPEPKARGRKKPLK